MEEVDEGTESTEGQAPEGTDGSQTTGGAPEGSEGQPAIETTDGTQEQTFFDPNSVPDELLPAYKNMQRAFGQKMEALSANRQKIEAYDAFSADPVGSLQNYARQYGFQLTRAEAAQQLQGNQPQEEWQPQNWNEVLERGAAMGEERAYNRMRQELGPMFQEVQSMKKQGIEQQLNDIDPTWRQYEDSMMENLRTHPTLSSDAALLYKMSVPEEVRESRATQRALARLEKKAESAQGAGKSSTTKHPSAELPDRALTFDESVKAAKKRMAEEGITPLGG
jgi:hypothetical protein